MHLLRRCSTLLILALPLVAQNQVIRQGASPTGAVDFTGATTTKPLRIVTTLPTSCAAGELLYLLNTGVFHCINGAFVATGNGGTWGTIGGTVANQTDLWNALQAKQPLMTIGSAGQYVRGDGSLGTLAAGSNAERTSHRSGAMKKTAIRAKTPYALTRAAMIRGDVMRKRLRGRAFERAALLSPELRTPIIPLPPPGST